jgi:hypothetical protein
MKLRLFRAPRRPLDEPADDLMLSEHDLRRIQAPAGFVRLSLVHPFTPGSDVEFFRIVTDDGVEAWQSDPENLPGPLGEEIIEMRTVPSGSSERPWTTCSAKSFPGDIDPGSMENEPPREPTNEECIAHAVIDFDGHKWMAIWYPQMGGYGAKAWVSIATWSGDNPPCFDVLVWHDGEFAFGGEDPDLDDGTEQRRPTRLHHCNAEQFIRFGEAIRTAQYGAKIPEHGS